MRGLRLDTNVSAATAASPVTAADCVGGLVRGLRLDTNVSAATAASPVTAAEYTSAVSCRPTCAVGDAGDQGREAETRGS